MKKITIFLFSVSLLFATDFSGKLGFETTYDSNILNLSENDIARFNLAEETDKFVQKTLDDLIFQTKIQSQMKEKILGHTNIQKFTIKYDNYLQNKFKDYFTFSFSVKQYFNRKINFIISYSYNPKLFVNRFDSVWDDAEVYRDFTYSKNEIYGKLQYKLFSMLRINYQYKISQSTHNAYFPEYDATATGHAINFELVSKKRNKLGLTYSFLNSQIDGEMVAENAANRKDGSYISDKYRIFAKLVEFSPFIFYYNFQFERKHYQTLNDLDTYHYGRIDDIYSLKFSLKYPFFNNYELRAFYGYEERKTTAFFSETERDKTYNLSKVGIAINILIGK